MCCNRSVNIFRCIRIDLRFIILSGLLCFLKRRSDREIIVSWYYLRWEAIYRRFIGKAIKRGKLSCEIIITKIEYILFQEFGHPCAWPLCQRKCLYSSSPQNYTKFLSVSFRPKKVEKILNCIKSRLLIMEARNKV